MKSKNILMFVVGMIMALMLSACSNNKTQNSVSEQSLQSTNGIYLYGEAHGVDKILDKEFELWNDYYQEKGMRHLFLELPYYTAEFLNLWMQSDSNDILDELFIDSAGTAGNTPDVKEFYETIKSQCPETIFHGTDVGHQYDTTGERYLNYLQENHLEDTEQFLLTQEAIEQGKYYYDHSDDIYRENKMVENFIREFDQLDGESIMGIYGAAHTGINSMDYTNSIACMANQLNERYSDILSSEDLTSIEEDIEPYRVDTIRVNGKDYEASYFGKEDLTGFKDYKCREFWRLENAYDDFKDCAQANGYLPYDIYPMQIKIEQVFVIDFTKIDGSVSRNYYRSDGVVWEGMLITAEFIVE